MSSRTRLSGARSARKRRTEARSSSCSALTPRIMSVAPFLKAPVTTRTSSASTWSPFTHSGLTSSTRSVPFSDKAVSPSPAIASATASRLAGGVPRAPCSSGRPRSSPSMRLTSAASTGSTRRLVSLRISTQIPPRPTASTGPNVGSTVTPARSSAPAEHGDAVGYRARGQRVFQRLAVLAHLAVAGGEDHRVRDARRAHVVEHALDRLDRRQDEGQVGRLRQVAQARHDRQAERAPGPRVNGGQPPGEARRGAARHDEPGPPGVVGGTDERDAVRGEERPQPLRRDEFARRRVHHHTRGSLGRPRARSPMMFRWISLVPE